ncbi:MAG: DUF6364 family protein [Chitinophagaceae bacterium]|nr:DUF6364 family protein [Chitinophagaceae bacterium]
MTTKLTLSINERTVQRAKILSRKRGKSISRIVEEYLDSISEKEEQKENPMTEIREVMSKYKGKITLPEDDNYNKMVRDWKYEDYIKKSTTKSKKK